MSALSTPAFLVDEGGLLVFFNEAAGRLLGKGFDEVGHVGPSEWGGLFGPYDEAGETIPYEELPVVQAVRRGRPPTPASASAPSTARSTRSNARPSRSSPRTGRGRRSRSSGRPRTTSRRGDRARAPPAGATAPRRTGPPREGRPLGDPRLRPLPRPGNDPLRRQHLLRRRHPRRRLAPRPRRRHRDPRPRPRPRRRTDPHPHPPHPPAPGPHPGPRLLRAALPQPDRGRDLGTGLPRGEPARPDRPLHLGAALAGRGARAALRRQLPRLPGDVGDRLGDDHRRLGRPPRPDARLPDRGRGLLARLHPRPRAGARRRSGDARARVDLRPRARRGRRPARSTTASTPTTSTPTHLGWGHSALSHALDLRGARRGAADAALPPRPDPLRRLADAHARAPRPPGRRAAAPPARSRWPARARVTGSIREGSRRRPRRRADAASPARRRREPA